MYTVWKTTVYIYNRLFQTPNKPGALRRINYDDWMIINLNRLFVFITEL